MVRVDVQNLLGLNFFFRMSIRLRILIEGLRHLHAQAILGRDRYRRVFELQGKSHFIDFAR